MIESIEEAEELLAIMEEYKRTHKTEWFKPYPYQQKFMDRGAKYKQRYLRAANRIGKTFGTAIEFSYHMTGRYPPNWKGLVVEDSGWEYWCIGVDLKQVARVQQKELLGVTKSSVLTELGTEAIPLEHIVLDGVRNQQDNITSIFIRHVDGGVNTLRFFASAQGQNTLMGSSVKGIWIDEIPPYDPEEIYSQCYTRTATTKGFVIVTATPEQGLTVIDRKYQNDTKDLMYIQEASVWDAHVDIGGHLDDEYIEGLKAATPEYMWPMRLEGKPTQGSGAVFPFEESQFTYDVLPNDGNGMMTNIGLDFGETDDGDPSVIVQTFMDTDTGCVYVENEKGFDKDAEDRSAANMADWILASKYPNVDIICPHDGAMDSQSDTARANIMRSKGVVNLYKNGLPGNLVGQGDGTVSKRILIKPGLIKMAQMMREGKLKINKNNCPNLLAEIRSYNWVPDGSEGKTKAKGFNGDHFIDAMRLSTMGQLCYKHSFTHIAMDKNAQRWDMPQQYVEYWPTN